MKIAIFGDSFAVNEIKNKRILDQKRIIEGCCYTHELDKKFDVTNFAVAGTGLFYSYEQFLEHRDKFDKIIFIAEHRRILLQHRDHPEYTHLNWSPTMLPKNQKEKKIFADVHGYLYNNKYVPYSWKEAIFHVKWYYKHIHDEKESHFMSKLIVQDLEKDKNVLVIPAFQSSYRIGQKYQIDQSSIETSFIKNYDCSTSLIEIIQQLEIPYYQRDFSDGTDTKFCHLSDENNKILFEKIKKWIETNQFTLHIDDFVTPSDNAKKYLP